MVGTGEGEGEGGKVGRGEVGRGAHLWSCTYLAQCVELLECLRAQLLLCHLT